MRPGSALASVFLRPFLSPQAPSFKKDPPGNSSSFFCSLPHPQVFMLILSPLLLRSHVTFSPRPRETFLPDFRPKTMPVSLAKIDPPSPRRSVSTIKTCLVLSFPPLADFFQASVLCTTFCPRTTVKSFLTFFVTINFVFPDLPLPRRALLRPRTPPRTCKKMITLP